MSNRLKQLGTDWETATADFLNEGLGQYRDHWKEGPRHSRWKDPRDPDNVERIVQTGAKDTGDLRLWPFIGECKNVKEITLAAFVKQANVEARHAGADYGVAFVKARGKGTGDGYAVMDIATFRRVLKELRSKRTN